MIQGTVLSVGELRRASRTRQRSMLIATLLAAGVLGLVAGELAASGHPYAIVMVVGLVFPVLMWRRPDLGIGSLVIVATLIEQFPIDQFPMSGQPAMILTDQVPLFTSFSSSYGVAGLMVSPVEILVLMTALIWLMKSVLQKQLRLPRSFLAAMVGAFLAIVVFGVVLGLVRGGSYREIIDEIRPFLYLIALYLLGSQLLKSGSAVTPILWGLVIGTGIKGLQGTIRFVALRGANPRPEAVLGHEEAVFFSLFLLLAVALWLFRERGRLRTVVSALAPFVLLADLGNNRRAAWLILVAGLVTLAAVAWVRLPDRRGFLSRWAIALALGASVYLPLYWNSNGGLAQPARAIRSVLSPSFRDNASDLYRLQENANLAFNIHRTMPLGAGFGIPIDYALPIVDLTKTTPSLAYVPHDTILYLWMRLGILGILAFFCLIGAAIVMACRLVRAPDQRLAIYGALVLCAIVAYVIEGYYDLGLEWYRIAVIMGCLLGGLEAVSQRASAPYKSRAGYLAGAGSHREAAATAH